MRAISKTLVVLVTCIIGCLPSPPPNPVYPTLTDASAPVDAAPANCASFAGRYEVTDTVVEKDGSCKTPDTKGVLVLRVKGAVKDQSENWDVFIDTVGSTTPSMAGLGARLEDRPYACRFVVEIAGSNVPSGLYQRDIILGERSDGHGRGEASGRDGDCVWRSSSVLLKK